MGNCIATPGLRNESQAPPRVESEDERVLLRIVKNEGRVFEYKQRRPRVVEDACNLQPLDCSHSTEMDGESSCRKRMKVKIVTRLQLQQLVSKKVSVEELLLRIQIREGETNGYGSTISAATRWIPVLETVPE